MTGQDKDRLWMAYLDGELTPAESAAFDAGLTPEERDRLAAEMHFESALAEALRGDVKCPDHVWRRAQVLVRNAGKARRRRVRLWWGAAFAAAAALVLSVFQPGLLPDGGANGTPHVLAAVPSTMAEFEARSEVPPTLEAVDAYLERNGIHLQLASLETVPHVAGGHVHGTMTLVGACEGDCPHHTMQALMFNCCGKPVRLLLAPLGSGGAGMLQMANQNHEVQRMAVVGAYLAAVVGEHPAPGLIDLLKVPTRQIV